jgi:hypothetical protein
MSEENDIQEFSQREKEWAEVEELVLQYQKQFTDPSEKVASDAAANELLKKFSPLFNKYLMLFKNGQIDFNDKEMKLFVLSFIEDPQLQYALRRKKQKATARADIYKRFKFIKETYGKLSNEEIMLDLQMMFLTVAKRYKQMGRNFCGYLYNSYHYEISRHIKKFIKNPLNIGYKNLEYEDTINGAEDQVIDNSFEDTLCEDMMGMPDMTWIAGTNCSDIFAGLSTLDRKILVKYYLEEWNDRQISEVFGIHINTVNQKRRSAVKQIAEKLNINLEEVRRNRRSGKNAILPIEI